MSFLRIKTITKNGKTYRYLVRQTNVRKGKRVYSIMEHLCGFGMAVLSPGTPGGFSGNRPTDKRHIKHQEESDRELFVKNRGAFNVKLRQEYERGQKARDAAKAGREAKMSRSEKAERAEAMVAEQSRADETMEAVREFNEARAKEKEPSDPQDGS
jgi:hypothetical protein